MKIPHEIQAQIQNCEGYNNRDVSTVDMQYRKVSNTM